MGGSVAVLGRHLEVEVLVDLELVVVGMDLVVDDGLRLLEMQLWCVLHPQVDVMVLVVLVVAQMILAGGCRVHPVGFSRTVAGFPAVAVAKPLPKLPWRRE